MFYKQAIRYYIMGKRWTKEEIEFIKNNSDKLTDREISEKLNRTWASVNSKRKEVGIASCKGKLTGEKHHSWKGGEEEVKCSICGKKINRNHSQIKNHGYSVCSNECKKKALKTNGKEKRKTFKGKFKSSDGYILVRDYEHPNSDGDGYVREHRLVMEKRLGRLLNKSEVVHHANGKKEDNRIENLRLFRNQREHIKYHIKLNKLFSNKGVFGK